MNKDEKPDRIEVRGARVHNLKNVSVDIPLKRSLGLPGYPAPAKVPLHWECCMQKDHGDTWNLFPPIHGGE